MTFEKQYLNLCDRILTEGKLVTNKRTGAKCYTIIGEQMKYDIGAGIAPLLTTRPSYPVSATAEMIGYLRRYTNAQDFEDIGTKSWWVNSDETEAWLNNPVRKGKGDMGMVYGAASKENEVEDILYKLKRGEDDRGLTIDYWKPEKFHLGCLRPCMRMHTFSLVDDTLYLTSDQRSTDVGCGLPFNAIQCYFLLALMAKLTGYKAGVATHNMINVHIYESHIDSVKEMLKRKPYDISPTLKIQDWVTDLSDVINSDKHAREYIKVEGYKCQDKLPFELIA